MVRNIALLLAFGIAIALVEVINFAFLSWKAIVSFPMLFLLLSPVQRKRILGLDLLAWCTNCGHRIKLYREYWKHFDGGLKTELCMEKGCHCMHPLNAVLVDVQAA